MKLSVDTASTEHESLPPEDILGMYVWCIEGLGFVNASTCMGAAAGASPARKMLEGWAEDADGGKLGTLLQRYGAGPPSRALLTTLGRQADLAAQDLACLVLAGAHMAL